MKPTLIIKSLFVLVHLFLRVIWSDSTFALDWDFNGQLSGWSTETQTLGEWENRTGLRYIPELYLGRPLDDQSSLDAEFSLNSFWVYNSDVDNDDYDLELYRAQLRYATAQTETRIGLQKINFGPGLLLRPLRWFDRLDPTDPQQLTEGVYALRFKYDTLDNAGLWLWCLYGNEDPKGYEFLPTVPDAPEIGGRMQLPVFGGELAATVHSRKVDGSAFNVLDFREKRFALDGKWDLGIGLWFESTFKHQALDPLFPQLGAPLFPYDWTKRIAIGMDYTFNWGNGLYMLFEHMAVGLSENMFGWDEDAHISAFHINYPIGIMDSLTAIGYYTWDQKDYYQYLRWQRTYDTILLAVSLFYYPETAGTDTALQGTNRGGRGGELLIIFNH